MSRLPKDAGGPLPDSLRTDALVLGSGPGGAITACLLAEAGYDVVVLEEGPWLDLGATKPFSREEMREKYRSGGVTVAIGNPRVAYAEGRCLGGGSEVNSGLYHRTPDEILDRWQQEFGLAHATPDDLAPHFEACERDLSVSLLPGDAPVASLKLHGGAEHLGWRSMEVPRWYRYGADGSEHKQSMTETFIPRTLAAGGRIFAGTRALRLRRTGSEWEVRCVTGRPERQVDIRARAVFSACGAVQTPALLRRSGIRKNVGNTLHFHPTVKVVARFDEVVNQPELGVPVHQVKEFSPRIGLGCSISAPPHLALAMADHPSALQEVMGDWPHHVVFYAMTIAGQGRIRPLPVFRDPLVLFGIDPPGLVDLADALKTLTQCALAAGATRVYPSIAGSQVIDNEADLASLPGAVPTDRTSVMTIHAFSSCPMGESPRCAADSFGRVHGAPGLQIADASLLCSPPGVNPQGSVMAFARRNVLHFMENGSPS